MFNEIIQGSTLDPFLFLIYVNNRFSNIDQQAIVYANDTTILIPAANKIEVTQTLIKCWMV